MSCIHGQLDNCRACEDLAVFIRARVPDILGPALRHRCMSCGLVKWIECRGHRRERAQHFAAADVERGVWNVFVAARNETVKREYIRFATTACKRKSSGVSLDWAKVDCLRCLKVRPTP